MLRNADILENLILQNKTKSSASHKEDRLSHNPYAKQDDDAKGVCKLHYSLPICNVVVVVVVIVIVNCMFQPIK